MGEPLVSEMLLMIGVKLRSILDIGLFSEAFDETMGWCIRFISGGFNDYLLITLVAMIILITSHVERIFQRARLGIPLTL